MEVWRLRSLVGDLVRRPAGALLHLLLAPGCGAWRPPPAVLFVLFVLLVLPRRPGHLRRLLARRRRAGGAGRTSPCRGPRGSAPCLPCPLPISQSQSSNQPNGGVWGDAPAQSNQPISQSALSLSLRRRSRGGRRRRGRRGDRAGLDGIGHLLQACRPRTQTRRTLSGRQRRGRRPTLTHRPRPLTPLTPIRTMPRR